MATTITAGNGTNGGAAVSSDNTGILELKTGTGSGTTAVTVGTGQNVTFAQAANLPNTFGFKNRIINGDMRIDQRNAGASVTPTASAYTLDRWLAIMGVASKYSVQQNAGSLSAANRPAGFTNYLGITSTSAYSSGASDAFLLNHYIEGFNTADFAWGTASAATITLSFWVRSSLTGTFSLSVCNAPADRTYIATYTISSANTWEQKTITISGETSGSWNTGNGIGVQVRFDLGSGSNFNGTAGSWGTSNLLRTSGSQSVVGTNGATFYITGVQLEKGSTATSFDYRPYGTELQLCQRYYFKKDFNSANDTVAVLQAYSTSAAFGKLADLPVTMRATPTGSLSAIGSFVPNDTTGNSRPAFTGGSISYVGTNQIGTSAFTGSSGLTAGSATVIAATATAWIAASAEL